MNENPIKRGLREKGQTRVKDSRELSLQFLINKKMTNAGSLTHHSTPGTPALLGTQKHNETEKEYPSDLFFSLSFFLFLLFLRLLLYILPSHALSPPFCPSLSCFIVPLSLSQLTRPPSLDIATQSLEAISQRFHLAFPGVLRSLSSTMPSVPIIFFFFATTTILPTFVSAQLIVPVCCMSYTNIDETRLYIQGGLNNNRTTVNQFIALDLTVPAWEASAPPWSKPQNLNGTNPPISSWHSMVAAKDRGKLFIWDALQTTAVWWTYNIVEKSWRNYAVPIGTPEMAATNSSYLVNITRQAGIRNGVNVATGEVYISSGTDNGTQMSIHTIDPTTGLPATSQPSSFKQDPIAHESFVWSGYRNSFLHYGGRSMNGTNSNSQLNELLSMNGWMAVVCFFCVCLFFVAKQ